MVDDDPPAHVALHPVDEAADSEASPDIPVVPDGLDGDGRAAPQDADPALLTQQDAEPGGAATLSDVLAMQHELREQVRQLGHAFEVRLKYDETKERVIDTLHQEVQRHRQGLQFQLLRPIFTDLIALYDDLVQTAARPTSDEAGLALSRACASFALTVEEILRRNGAEAYACDGDELDSKRQRVVRTVPTADPSAANRVAERLRKGFATEERVLRPELVATYRLQDQ